MRKGGLVTEARLMQQLGSHPNLCQFYRWSTDTRGNEYVVCELVPFGSLDKVLAHFGPSLRNRSKLMMCEQICHAMSELASEGVLHRDLAARNILVQSMQPVHIKAAFAIMNGELLPRPKNCPQPVYSLMVNCWAADPRQRPSFRQIADVFRRWREATLAAKAASGAGAGGGSGTNSPAVSSKLPLLSGVLPVEPAPASPTAHQQLHQQLQQYFQNQLVMPRAAAPLSQVPEVPLSSHDTPQALSNGVHAGAGGAASAVSSGPEPAAPGGGYVPITALWRPDTEAAAAAAQSLAPIQSGELSVEALTLQPHAGSLTAMDARQPRGPGPASGPTVGQSMVCSADVWLEAAMMNEATLSHDVSPSQAPGVQTPPQHQQSQPLPPRHQPTALSVSRMVIFQTQDTLYE
eukprot:XP_001689899.1 predicted protein [Chlamydomonas reinhardtii]